jgi:hypothetical protein
VPRQISIQQATLYRARDLAGGVSYLSRALLIGANELDEMLHGRMQIPSWIFLRAVDYVNENETHPDAPLGAPPGHRNSQGRQD